MMILDSGLLFLGHPVGLRVAGSGNDASLDSHQPQYRTPSYSLHHTQVICKRGSSHYHVGNSHRQRGLGRTEK